MRRFLKHAVAVIATVAAIPFCEAALSQPRTPVYYDSSTAPDALSRDILNQPIRSFHEGALTPQEIPAAIHRNFPVVLEQSVAAMPSAYAKRWIDQLSDIELEHMAQLYVSANSDAGRSGRLLQLMALRLDGGRLGRLSRFFGYNEVYAAVAASAPATVSYFLASSPIAFSGPVTGAPLRVPPEVARNSVTAMGGFTPQITMSLSELYTGFRSMQVGSLAATAAIYELVQYSGKYLVGAYAVGYSFGTGISSMMETYTPDFYQNTFVPAVGGSIAAAVNYIQGTVLQVDANKTNTTALGGLQQQTIPVFGDAGIVQNEFGSMGGDYGVCYEYESLLGGGPCRSNCGPHQAY